MTVNSSYHQQRMWFIDNFEKDYIYEGGPVYHNIPLAIIINGSFSKEQLFEAIEKLIGTHEILRTKLVLGKDNSICQKIYSLEEAHRSQLLFEEQNIFERYEEYIKRPFDYKTDFLFRGYFELKENEAHILLVLNHAIADKYTAKYIRKYLIKALVQNDFSELSNAIQYKDFSNWQNDIEQDALNSLLFYWKAQLKNAPILYFSTDKEREHIHIYKNASIHIDIPKHDLDEFCKKHGGSAKLFLLTMYKMTLSKLTDINDIVVGTFMSLRNPSKNILLGPVDNLVVLRTTFSANESIQNGFKKVMKSWESAVKYKALPFDKLVKELNPKKDRSRTALFDMLYSYNEIENQSAVEDEINLANQGWGKYDFNLCVNEKVESYRITLAYNALYFESYTAESFVNTFKKLIEDTIENEDILINEFHMLAKKETSEILNRELSIPTRSETICDVFAEQVKVHDQKVALVGSNLPKLTYTELNEESNRLANFLIEKYETQVGDRIAVLLPKTEKLIVVLLAILKSGGTYVPIDLKYPEERRRFMISDSACKLTLDEAFLEKWQNEIDKKSELQQTQFTITSDDIAYIIYTSGTTGNPKGVMVTHGNVCSLLHSCYEKIQVDEHDTWTQFHSHCFDFSVWEIFGCLLSGGKLLMVDTMQARDAIELAKLMDKHNVTIFSQTPSAFYSFIAHSQLKKALRYVIFGGEMLMSNKLKEWSSLNPEVELINMYGITETTVHVTFKKINESDMNSTISNIGKPLSFAKVYILNKEQQLVPFGRSGEMYVAGAGVAKGYLDRPKLNETRFLQDLRIDGERMYKTGDKARWLPNGELEYLGRLDNQVKIRGYRIELGEIEKTAAEYSDSISHTIAEAKEIRGEMVIVLYYHSETEISQSEIRTFLQQKMPEYMIPDIIIYLDELQLTINGKIDRKNLPTPTISDLQSDNYVAPESKMEEALALIWSKALGIEKVGREANFFLLGGHSLKMIEMQSHILKDLQININISEIFSHPTLKDLAKIIQDKTEVSTSDSPSLRKLPNARAYPLAHAQKRFRLLHKMNNDKSAYNVGFALKIKGAFQKEILQDAVDRLVERHEILRTIFTEFEQVILPPQEGRVTIQDLKIQEESLPQDLLRAMMKKNFDLESGPLFAIGLLHESFDTHYLLFNFHHIVFDDWSQEILVNELFELYISAFQDRPANLEAIKWQYKEYADWKYRIRQSNQFKLAKDYWMSQFSILPEILELPYDFSRPKIKSFNGDLLSINVDAELVKVVKDYAQSNGLTMASLFMSCFKILLYKYSGQNDIVVGIPVSDRDYLDLNNQIGPYLNTLAIRSVFDGSSTIHEFIDEVNQTLIKGLMHKEYPFDELIENLKMKRDIGRSPLFDVMFVHQNKKNKVADGFNNIGLDVEEVSIDSKSSIFDLLFNVIEFDDQIKLRLTYNTDLFTEQKIERLLDHFLLILERCIQQGDKSLSEFSILTDEEKLLYSTSESEEIKHISEALQNQLLDAPDGLALRYQSKEYSLSNLHDLSENIAANLSSYFGVQTGDRVAVYCENPTCYPLCLLAIFKMGGCFLPIDINSPKKRVELILEDARPKVIITDHQILAANSKWLSADFSELEISTDRVIFDQAKLEAPAFIIYTSGTTGKPKGVIQTYKTISNLIQWQSKALVTASKSNYLQYASFTFDVAVQDIIFCFTNGVPLYLPESDEKRDFDKLYRFILENDLKILSLPYSVLRSFISAVDSNRLSMLKIDHIVTYGEQLIITEKLSSFLLENPQTHLHNYYGPSETHVVTAQTINGSEDLEEYLSIGKPITNNRAYVLDNNLQLVPKGVKGKLYISGANVFSNYVDSTTPTRKVALAYANEGEELAYDTGDIVFWREDNTLQFVGRKDDQIKINGNRIEIKEIENVLENHELVEEAFILCLKKGGNYFLYAFYTTRSEVQESDIRDYMKEILPSYMIPQTFRELDKFPLNKNGKKDKIALERLVPERSVQLKASDKTIQELTNLWEENLKISIPSIDSNYFELGGHSLSTMVLLNQIRSRFNCEVTIEDVFENSTLSMMALFIKNASSSEYYNIPVLKDAPAYSLSPSQLSFWLKIQSQEDKDAHNISMSLIIQDSIELSCLNEALNKTIDRHESLRTIFSFSNGNPQQIILEKEKSKYVLSIKKDHRPKENWDEISSIRPAFKIDQWPLFNINITEVATQTNLVTVDMHHLISDGWSLEIFAKELLLQYNALVYNEEYVLPALKVQYKDYAAWMNSLRESEPYKQSENYWKTQLKGANYQTSFAKKRLKDDANNLNGDSFVFTIPKNDALTKFVAQHEVSTYVLVLTVLFLLKNKYSQERDLMLASVSAGRIHKDIEQVIGYFLNAYLLRVKVDRKMMISKLLEVIKDLVIKALKHQEYPFEKTLEILYKEKRMVQNKRIYELGVTYQTSVFNQDNKVDSQKKTSIVPWRTKLTKVKDPFWWYITEFDHHLMIDINYNIEMYSRETVESITNDFNSLFKELLTQKTELSIYELKSFENKAVSQIADDAYLKIDDQF